VAKLKYLEQQQQMKITFTKN